MKRVVLTGAESTGKTTLARALAAHYKTVWAPEYLRQFVDEKGALPVETETPAIAQGHLAQERRLLPKANRVLFLDTDLISTCLYHRYIFGTSPGWVQEQATLRQADLYLLMDTDIPWVPDPGQRDGPKAREATQRLFVRKLQHLPHVLISGSFPRRFDQAVQHVDRLLDPTADPLHSGSRHEKGRTRA